jgi:hypothetical protein
VCNFDSRFRYLGLFAGEGLGVGGFVMFAGTAVGDGAVPVFEADVFEFAFEFEFAFLSGFGVPV